MIVVGCVALCVLILEVQLSPSWRRTCQALVLSFQIICHNMAIRGHGCPTCVDIVTWKVGSSMYPEWSGGDSRNYPLVLLHTSHAHLAYAFQVRDTSIRSPRRNVRAFSSSIVMAVVTDEAMVPL